MTEFDYATTYYYKNPNLGDKTPTVSDADYASFKTKSDAGCVAQDKNGYWFWNDRKAWKDMNSEEKERVKALQ